MSIKIYVDQGHNPRDFNTGAEGNGFYEQDITYKVGKLLFDLLSSDQRFEPILSRPNPNTTLGVSNSSSLTARVNQANASGADLFLSLHTNASTNENANGSEALIYSNDSEVARGVAEDILEQMTRITGLRNRGIVERPGLYVLKRTRMPAVLVEMGFITNPAEAELMAYSPELFAEGIYRGLVEYYFDR